MKEYYIHDGNAQKGPMTLEELLKSGIKADTFIWHTDLEGWTPAKNLEELKLIFDQKVPPAFEQVQAPPPPKPPISSQPEPENQGKHKGRSSIGLWLLLAAAGIALVAFIYNRQNSGGAYTSQETYSENKMSVGDYERSHPTEFLDADGTYNPTLFGKKLRVHGTVTNRATVANFKDIVIEARYYSSTNTLISKERFVLYDFVPAHSKKSFEWKIKPPGGTDRMGWDAVEATPY